MRWSPVDKKLAKVLHCNFLLLMNSHKTWRYICFDCFFDGNESAASKKDIGVHSKVFRQNGVINNKTNVENNTDDSVFVQVVLFNGQQRTQIFAEVS